MNKIWITGTHYEDEGDENVIIEPLLKIERLSYNIAEICYRSLIATSAHAIHDIERKKFSSLQVVHVVGQKAASIVGNIFNVPIYNYSNVESLMSSIDITLTPILYLRGVDISRDIYSELRAKDINIDQVISYQATPIRYLPDRILNMLKKREIAEIKIYSQRGYDAMMQFAQYIDPSIRITFCPNALEYKCKKVSD